MTTDMIQNLRKRGENLKKDKKITEKEDLEFEYRAVQLLYLKAIMRKL